MKKILNAGCGNDIYGTDFIDKYPQRKEVIKCDVDKDKLPYSDNFFDEVYSFDLFEHLTNPLFFLKEARRVLKSGGRIVLTTSYAHCMNWIFNACVYEKPHGKEDKHYLLVNEYHMKNWFDKAGLKIIEMKFLEDDYVGNPLWKKIIKKVFNKLFKNSPLRRMSYYRIKVVGKK
jgi:cyclopropane fatty-acyl-phospholipid synthase-like methyltransferase